MVVERRDNTYFKEKSKKEKEQLSKKGVCCCVLGCVQDGAGEYS